MQDYDVRPIPASQTYAFILDIHYAHRKPPISYAFGLFQQNFLVGICTFGVPASQFLCKGICGEAHKKQVLELNRLVLLYNRKNEGSYLISQAVKQLPPNRILVSYADSAQNHIGYVYQAVNWLYTGKTKARTDMVGKNGKHPRHYQKGELKRVVRSAKHRYVTFTGNRRERAHLQAKLNYPILPYPKS